jgi:outer membrane protein TolC
MLKEYEYAFDNISREALYTRFIGPSRSHLGVSEMLRDAKNKKKALDQTITNGTKQAVYGVIYARDGLARSTEFVETLKEKDQILKSKYQLGLVSKYEVEKNEIQLRKSIIDNEKLGIQVASAELMLNKLLGYDFGEEITFDISTVPTGYSSMKTYEEYLETALVERNEILIAQLKLKNLRENEDVMKDFIIHEEHSKRIEIKNDIIVQEVETQKVLNDVTIDVLNAYIDLTDKKENLDYLTIKFDDASITLNSVKIMEELGLVTKLNIIEAKIGYDKAINDYEKGVNDFKLVLDTMERKASVGIMSTGGM